jgi:carboxyl-terminal processing protease
MKLKRTILGPVLVAGVAVLSGGWLLQRESALSTGGVDPRIFDEVLSRVSRDYVDSHPQDELYKMAVDGMLYELGDPHTNFMTAEEYNDLRVQTTGEYGGLGIQIAERNGWITVVAPLPGTPAERAGIRAGDRIIEVEGKSTQGWKDDDAVKVLRGPRGSVVHIKVARPGIDASIPFDITREAIHVQSVTSYLIEPTVGLLRLNLFAETSTEEMKAAIEKMRSQGMQSLILDLRTNPGGLLDQGVSVSNLFLHPGLPIVETRGRDPRETEKFGSTRPAVLPDSMSIVVLVDEYSASAAEIVSGALQDHDRALVVGSTTYGKGSVQSLFPLSGGNFLKMTTGRWYTPSGRSIQKDHKRPGDLADLAGTPVDTTTALGPDGTPIAVTIDTTKRKAYRTDSGRIVYGGGGIVPDLTVKPDTLTTAEQAFSAAAGKAAAKFNDATFKYAIDYVRTHPNLAQSFTVSDAMLEEFFGRLKDAGVPVTHEQYMGASRIIRRQLGFEIAYSKWGSAIAAQRANADDAVVRKAVELLRGAPSPQALFRAAEAQRQAAR